MFLLWLCSCDGPLRAGVAVYAHRTPSGVFVWCSLISMATAVTPGLRDSVPETTGLTRCSDVFQCTFHCTFAFISSLPNPNCSKHTYLRDRTEQIVLCNRQTSLFILSHSFLWKAFSLLLCSFQALFFLVFFCSSSMEISIIFISLQRDYINALPYLWCWPVSCRPGEETSAVSISPQSTRVLLTCPLWQNMWENILPFDVLHVKVSRQFCEFPVSLSTFLRDLLCGVWMSKALKQNKKTYCTYQSYIPYVLLTHVCTEHFSDMFI